MKFIESFLISRNRAGYLLCLILLYSASAWSQKVGDPIKESRELISEGVALHDKENYDEAIKKYRQVSRNDSMYYLAVVELALSYHVKEEYDKAVELLTDLYNDRDNTYRRVTIKSLGDALEMTGKADSARTIYAIGMKEFPYEYRYHYETGISYERQKQYDKAIESYKKALRINIMHASSHLRLGILAASANRPALSLMALETYIILNPNGGNIGGVIEIMEQSSTNEYTPDSAHKNVPSSLFAFAAPLEDLDAMLLSKAALSDKYKARIKLSFKILKQLQLLCEKSPEPTGSDWLLDFYTKFFSDMLKQDMFNGGVLFSLSALNSDKIQDEVKKNKKAIEAFKPWAFNYYEKARRTGSIPAPDGTTGALHYFDGSGNMQAVGQESSDGKRQNYWWFYHDNGVLMAEGKFVNDLKTGPWKYYYETGMLKLTEIYGDNEAVDGTYTQYYSNGSEKQKGSFKNGKMNGELILYNANRSPEQKLTIVNDKLNGPRVQYDGSGFKTFEVKDVDGVYQDTYRTFHSNGAKEFEIGLVDGKISGKAVYYSDKGKLSTEGAFAEGERTGEWTWYDEETGKVTGKGQYVKGKQNGLWVSWHKDGKTISSEENYANNVLTGAAKYYDENGKLYKEVVLRSGRATSFKYYDTAGNVIDQGEAKKGSLSFVNYTANRTKVAEGTIKADKMDGPWKYYYPNGAVETEVTYKNDEMDGVLKHFYANGKLHYEMPYVNGSREGYYRSLYKNGNISVEGYYKDNEQNGDWKDYFPNGKISTLEYYVDGVNTGYIYNYHANGKLDSKDDWRAGFFSGSVQYDTAGKVLNTFTLNCGNGYLQYKTLNKKPHYHGKYVYAYKDSICTSWYTNGKKRSIETYKFAKRNGPYKAYHENGNLSQQGINRNGKQDSLWTYYFENGKVSKTIEFRNGEINGFIKAYYDNGNMEYEALYKDDEKHGTSKFYGPNGEFAAQMEYESGVLKSYTYPDKTNKLVPPVLITNGTGTVKTFYANGNPSMQFTIDHGYYQGKYIEYYANGKTYVECTYVAHELEGELKAYYPDGQLKKLENYFYDELDGTAKRYNEGGKLVSETNYLGGDRHGYRSTWDATGKLTGKVLYLFGQAYE
jgi:antitoxin component YwqK of YwqJK toxin-antitoxin module/tetratricopeptide (TPR) repeat protein